MANSDTKQLGPRIGAEIADDFKQIVNFQYGKTRGTLGNAIEEALKMYIAKEVYAEIERNGHLDNLVEEVNGSSDFQKRLKEYGDEAGPEYLEVCNFLRGDAPDQDSRTGSPILGGQTDAAQEWEALSGTSFQNDTANSGTLSEEQKIEKVVQETIRQMEEN